MEKRYNHPISDSIRSWRFWFVWCHWWANNYQRARKHRLNYAYSQHKMHSLRKIQLRIKQIKSLCNFCATNIKASSENLHINSIKKLPSEDINSLSVINWFIYFIKTYFHVLVQRFNVPNFRTVGKQIIH